jgi:antitoxin (DNA-binding transcriptional repressor) of toxin-antitoxin stability system
MRRLTATEAARRFSDVLDQVEHDGETFLVERHGRVIASVAPAAAASGRSVKALLRAQPVDERWAQDLAALRAGLEPQERRWNA